MIVVADTSSLNYLVLTGRIDGMALVETLRADLMLLDDKAARKAATTRGISFVGILGIFRDAARAGLIDLEASIEALRQTNFHMSDSLVSEILNESRK